MGLLSAVLAMVMDVARTSMMHAAAPHFLWPFAVRYAAHQINFHPRVDAVEPVEVTGDSGAAGGAEPGGADSGGAERVGATPGGAGPTGGTPGGAETGGAEPGGAEPGGATPGGAGPGGATSGGGEPRGATSRAAEPGGAEPAVRWACSSCASGLPGAGGVLLELLSAAEGACATGPGGARTRSTGATWPVGLTGAKAAEGVGAEATAVSPGGGLAAGAAGGTAAGGAVGAGAAAEGAGAVSAVSGVAARPRPYFVPLLQQVLGLPPSTGPPPPLECPPPVHLASRPASPVRAARSSGCGSRQRPPPVPGTHRMSLRPSTAPLHAPLPSPPESSLPALADPKSDSLRAASPTVKRLLVTVVTNPSFESTAASALVAELVDFAAHCRLDYAASLVVESASVCPPSVGGEFALVTDVREDKEEEFQCLAAASPHLVSVLLTPEGDPDALDIPTPHSYAETVEGPYSSQWQAAMDAEMASWKSTGL
ncbi:unnamed protein product [Closterium sp. NIES-64]|nr:unnamed protein product [Closterium sp. NIES-64]